MTLSRRSFHGPSEWAAMTAVVHAQPGDQLHVVDLPYRMSSWAFDEPANCSLWDDAAGRILAWAVLQSPFWTIDYAIHPSSPPGTLATILDWADQRARELLGSPFGRPAWFINAFAGSGDQETFEAFGFRSQANVGENAWTKVLFQRGTEALLAYQSLPAGFHIRPLGGVQEVDAYVALHRAVFQSENMTAGWRRRTLTHPDYLPQLDLVLLDVEQRLAGFCVGWFNLHGPEQQPAGQIEPMGIRADLRGRGLGLVLLRECLSRLAELGARSLFVETDNYRDAAFGLYTAAGFQVAREVIVYRKDYAAE